MREWPHWLLVAALAAVLAGVPGYVHAEVAHEEREDEEGGDGQAIGTITMGVITDDPDPISLWTEYREGEEGSILNPGGDVKGDGPPALAWDANSEPIVAWAYNSGIDFDIALSEWENSAWTPVEFLAQTADDELDPHVFVEDDGTVHVSWWTDGATEEVWVVTRAAGCPTFDPAVLVTEGTAEGRRPSIAVSDGKLHVAFERSSTEPGMTQDVVAATQQPGGTFAFEVLGSTTRADPLAVKLHTQGVKLWADWKNADQEFGCIVHQQGTGWGTQDVEPWTDPSWVGVESVRKTIRRAVVSP